jgi:phosphoribosylformylglycinamidine synthase
MCKNVYIKAETSDSLITQDIPLDRALKIPIAHAEGRYFVNDEQRAELKANDQVLFRYCDENGNVTPESNCNGSVDNIAGVCNRGRNVFGMMPHPERASDEALGNTDGKFLFDSILKSIAV